MDQMIWVIVAVVAVAVLAAAGFLAVRGRRKRAPFEVRPFPANYVQPYEHRIEEIERMFVNQPREAVAAAKLLVDDMLTRMGYPVRMSGDERARDMRHFNKEHGERYRTASALKSDPTTEEMRRALKGYLDTGRDLIAGARRHHEPAAEEAEGRREIAG